MGDLESQGRPGSPVLVIMHVCASFVRLLGLVFELGSHHVSLAVLELTLYNTQKSSCLCFLSAGIKGKHYHHA